MFHCTLPWRWDLDLNAEQVVGNEENIPP